MVIVEKIWQDKIMRQQKVSLPHTLSRSNRLLTTFVQPLKNAILKDFKTASAPLSLALYLPIY